MEEGCTVQEEAKTSSDADSREDLDDSSSSSLDKKVEAMEIDSASKPIRSEDGVDFADSGDEISHSQSFLPELDRKSMERQMGATTSKASACASSSQSEAGPPVQGAGCSIARIDTLDSDGRAGQKRRQEDSSQPEEVGDGCGSEEMVTFTESESGEDRQGSDRQESASRQGTT